MSIQPVTGAQGTRAVNLAPTVSTADIKLKTIQDIFDWLRGLASSPQERLQLDAEESAFMKRSGLDGLIPQDGLTAKSLVNWALNDVSPFDLNPPSPETVETIDALKSLLAHHLKHKSKPDFDRVLYLLRSIDHDKVDMNGKPKPQAEPAVRDIQNAHGSYNDRTAYLEKHHKLRRD